MSKYINLLKYVYRLLDLTKDVANFTSAIQMTWLGICGTKKISQNWLEHPVRLEPEIRNTRKEMTTIFVYRLCKLI